MRNYSVVVKEAKETSPALQAVKLLATYFQHRGSRDVAVEGMKELMSESAAASDKNAVAIAATMFLHEADFESVLRLCHGSKELEQCGCGGRRAGA